MPSTRIEIEFVHKRWHAEVELGGISARRQAVVADSFSECIEKVCSAYATHTGEKVVLTAPERALPGEPQFTSAEPLAVEAIVEPAVDPTALDREGLLALATARCIDVKPRTPAHILRKMLAVAPVTQAA